MTNGFEAGKNISVHQLKGYKNIVTTINLESLDYGFYLV